MTITVELIPRHVRMALQVAKDRNESYKKFKSYQDRLNRVDRHPAVDNLIGVIGELAFAIHFDISIDSGVYEGGDDGIDFHVKIDGERTTIDMKTRATEPSYFWVKENGLDADYYALGHLHEPIDLDVSDINDIDTLEGWEVELIGTATREEFLDARKVDSDLGHINRSIIVGDLNALPDPDEIKQVNTSQGW